MRVRPRVPFMGFLLVVGLAVGGCQPVQPVASSPTPSGNEIAVESTPVTDTAVLPALVLVAETSPVTTTAAMTVAASVAITATSEMSGPAVSSPAGVNVDSAQLAVGLGVYRAQYCGVCHTLDTAETRGTFGPAHDEMGAVAAERLQDERYSGTAMSAADYIRESIVDPQLYIVPGYATTSHRMPPYAHLDAESLDALVAFLLVQ